MKLDELFKSENVYLPTRDELKIQLMKLHGNISDAKCEFVKELKYQFSNLEYLEPEIIDFCPRYDVCRDTVKVLWAGYDCVEVTSKMYLNVTLDTKLECTTQYYADELGKLLMAIKNDIEDVVNYIETRYHISIEYAVDIA